MVAQVSVQVKKQAQEEAEHFEGPILEYGRMTMALKTALHKRNEKKITYLTASNDLEAKRAHHSKLVGMGGDRQVKMKENETRWRSRLRFGEYSFKKLLPIDMLVVLWKKASTAGDKNMVMSG